MKTRSLMILAIFSLFSASAYAGTYTCTPSNGAGIYDLSLDMGTASLRVDGVEHTATGGGSMYTFNESFPVGDAVFNSPTLYVPMDASSAMQFIATLCDRSTGARVDLNCSH
jgi:hypothetical protein